MSLSDALLMAPVRFDATTYDLVVTANAVQETLTFPASGALTVGRNYWVSGDAQADASTLNGPADLLTLLDACLESHSELSSVTCALGSTFGVSITSSVSCTIEWSSGSTTLDPAVFGFDATDLTGTAIDSQSAVPTLWRPEASIAKDTRARQAAPRSVAVSLAGIARVARYDTPEKTREVGFVFLGQEKALAEYASGASAFETWWVDYASYGYAVRLYEDEDSMTSSDYTLHRVEDATYERSEVDPYYWDVSLKLRAVTA